MSIYQIENDDAFFNEDFFQNAIITKYFSPFEQISAQGLEILIRKEALSKIYINPSSEIGVHWRIMPLSNHEGLDEIIVSIDNVVGNLDVVVELQSGLLKRLLIEVDTAKFPFSQYRIDTQINFQPNGRLKVKSLLIDAYNEALIIS